MSTSTATENPLSFSLANSHSRPRPNRSTSAATSTKSRAWARSNQREQLVGCQLFEGQGRPERPVLDRTDPRVRRRVHFSRLTPVDDCQPDETVSGALTAHLESRRVQCRLDSRHEPVHLTGRPTEEVKVTSRTVDHPRHHERRATGESESVRFGQPGHDASHPLLQRAQHATVTPRRASSHLA